MRNIEEIAEEEEGLSREILLSKVHRALSVFGFLLGASGWFLFSRGQMGKGAVLILISLGLFAVHWGMGQIFSKVTWGAYLAASLVFTGSFFLYSQTHTPSFFWGKDPAFWLSVHAGLVGEPPWSPLSTLLGQGACFIFPRSQFYLLPGLSSLILAIAMFLVMLELFRQLKSKNILHVTVGILFCAVLVFARWNWDEATIASGLIAALGLLLFLAQRALLSFEEKPWKSLYLLLGLLFSVHPLWGVLGLMAHFSHLDNDGKGWRNILLPLALGLTPYLWVCFRMDQAFGSWGGSHPFLEIMNSWKTLWDWHFQKDWDPWDSLGSIGVNFWVLFILFLFFGLLNLAFWRTGPKKIISLPDTWVWLTAVLFGFTFYSTSSEQPGPTSLWATVGLASMVLRYAEKGMEKKPGNWFSGRRLVIFLVLSLLTAIGLAWLPGQRYLRSHLDLPEQHAFNLLRALDNRTVMVFEDAFEANACQESMLLEPIQPKDFLLERRYLNKKWYITQCIRKDPELLFSRVSGSPDELFQDLLINNLDRWDIQWCISQMPANWKGPSAYSTVLGQKFERNDLDSTGMENIQFRYDLSALTQTEMEPDAGSVSTIQRYSIGFNELGKELLARNHYASAIRAFERAVNLNGGFDEPRKTLAQIYSQQNILEAARLELEKTVKQHPIQIAGLMLQLDKAKREKDDSRTVQLLDDMIRLNNELSDAQYHLSLVYEKEGRLAESKSLLESSVKLNPQRVESQLTYGRLMARMGNRIKAEEAFRSVLEVDPVNKEAQVELWKLLNQP